VIDLQTHRPDSLLSVESGKEQSRQSPRLQEILQLLAHIHPLSPQDDILLVLHVLALLVEFLERTVELGVPASLHEHIACIDDLAILELNGRKGETGPGELVLSAVVNQTGSTITEDG
jgi:hypothetical protein